MSHILEVDAAERARAGGGVYHFGAPNGGGYAVAGGPVVVSGVKAPAETDAQRADRLAQEVGRLEYELRKVRRELEIERCGDGGEKGEITTELPYGSGTVIVAYTEDRADTHDGRTVTDLYLSAVWIGGQWVPSCELGAFADSLQSALEAA